MENEKKARRPNKEDILKSDMTNTEKAKNLAGYYFTQGLNCAECVMLACIDVYGQNIPREAVSLATGFGGGMGRTRNTCGAVTGAVMALGMKKGRTNPLAKEEVKDRRQELGEIYPDFGEMVEEIKDNYGTLICSELLDPAHDFEGKEKKKGCQQIIIYCAEKAAVRLEKTEEIK